MSFEAQDTVLLVCADEARAVRWIDRLYAAGCNVVGPAPTASVALTLAMHAAPAAAILVGPTIGRRSAEELAADLERLWGVASYAPTAEAAGGPSGLGTSGLPLARVGGTSAPVAA